MAPPVPLATGELRGQWIRTQRHAQIVRLGEPSEPGQGLRGWLMALAVPCDGTSGR